MCGIFGFSRLTPLTRRILPFLAWEMETRGRDSWGCTNGINLMRRMGTITERWEVCEWGDGPYTYHTRAASQGEVNLTNCHPHAARGEKGYVVGVHNGCITNHQMLNVDYQRSFTCDSQHIFAQLAEGLPTEKLYGWGAVVWFQTPPGEEEPRLHMSRFGRAELHVGSLASGELVWASTAHAIEKAARITKAHLLSIESVASDKLSTLDSVDEFDFLDETKDLKWATYVAPITPYVRPQAGAAWNPFPTIGDGANLNPPDEGYCPVCHHHKVDFRKAMLCDLCFALRSDAFWAMKSGKAGVAQTYFAAVAAGGMVN